MEDSWQEIRIQKTLKGIPDEHTAREGLFDIIHKSKSHHQKRAYQCIKLLVALFSQCEAAKTLLDESEDIRIKWSWAVNWLNEELERGRGHYPGSGQFSYNNWSPPAQSNETANGYFLERSHSARLTLEKACELLPDEVNFIIFIFSVYIKGVGEASYASLKVLKVRFRVNCWPGKLPELI